MITLLHTFSRSPPLRSNHFLCGSNHFLRGSSSSLLLRTFTKDLFPDLMTTMEATLKLRDHFCRRGMSLTNRLKHKPWRLALLIHRYDKGVPLESIVDKGFQTGFTPKIHAEKQWIRDNAASIGISISYGKKKRKLAKDAIIQEQQEAYVQEAIQVMKDHGLWKDEMNKIRTEHNVGHFLNYFARLMAHEGSFEKTIADREKIESLEKK